jgi:hypothetical protein
VRDFTCRSESSKSALAFLNREAQNSVLRCENLARIDSNDEPGDLHYFVADALAGTLAHHHRLLHEKWGAAFRSHAAAENQPMSAEVIMLPGYSADWVPD